MTPPLQTVYPEPEAGLCVNHTGREAETLCEVCGDLLCGGCVLPHHGITFCPTCFSRWRAGHAVLAEEEGFAGGGGTLVLGLTGLLLTPFVLVPPSGYAWIGVTIWLVCLALGLGCLVSARGLRQLVVEGKRGESGRLMARIGSVLAVMTITSASLALLLLLVVPKPVAAGAGP